MEIIVEYFKLWRIYFSIKKLKKTLAFRASRKKKGFCKVVKRKLKITHIKKNVVFANFEIFHISMMELFFAAFRT